MSNEAQNNIDGSIPLKTMKHLHKNIDNTEINDKFFDSIEKIEKSNGEPLPSVSNVNSFSYNHNNDRPNTNTTDKSSSKYKQRIRFHNHNGFARVIILFSYHLLCMFC